jgi:hypothetical protein
VVDKVEAGEVEEKNDPRSEYEKAMNRRFELNKKAQGDVPAEVEAPPVN